MLVAWVTQRPPDLSLQEQCQSSGGCDSLRWAQKRTEEKQDIKYSHSFKGLCSKEKERTRWYLKREMGPEVCFVL